MYELFQVKRRSGVIEWTGTLEYLEKLARLLDPSVYTLYAGDVVVARQMISLLLKSANSMIGKVTQDKADSFMLVSLNAVFFLLYNYHIHFHLPSYRLNIYLLFRCF